MNPSISQRLVAFGLPLQYDALPAAVADKTRMALLDTIGVAIEAVHSDFGVAARDLISGWGGPAQSSLIGQAQQVSAQNAALFNGILSHGQDYDDTHTESVVHGSAALVPVALAVAEQGHRSGRELVAALAVGLESAIRIALPAQNRFHLRGFHTTAVCAPFGAALLAAKLRGLDATQTTHALGITGSFASGVMECVPAAAGSKRLHGGWAGSNGIVAASFAAAGTTGPTTVFEGTLGVYRSFLRGDELDLDSIFTGLGQDWEVLNISPKLYPCCHYLQSPLDCALALRERHGVRWQDIEQIECRVAQGAVNIVCEPWARKITPVTGYDARFSLAFAIAIMLVKGKGGMPEFSEASCADAGVQACMKKIRYTVNPAYNVKDMACEIIVTLTSGARHAVEIAHVRGAAAYPIPQEEMLTKFYANTAALGRARSEQLAEQVLNIDRLGDVGELMAGLRAL